LELNSTLKLFDEIQILNQIYTLDVIQIFQAFIFIQVIPLAPLLLVAFETVALKSSLYSFLTAFKRTLNKPCRGIGLWVIIRKKGFGLLLWIYFTE
jgi:hypothetical protein